MPDDATESPAGRPALAHATLEHALDADLPQEEPLEPPVFVLSHERSGSTLLRNILNTHSQVASQSEAHVGQLAFQLQELLFRTLGQLEPRREPGALRLAVNTRVRRLLGGMFNTYVREQGKRVFCDKTPANANYLAPLDEVFPDSRFVCLYRHPFDVANSSLEYGTYGFVEELAPYVARQPTNLVAAMLESWADRARTLLALERTRRGRCHRLRYEDVVTDPGACLPGVFAFLGLGWESDIPERVFTRDHGRNFADPRTGFVKSFDPSRIGRGRAMPADRIAPKLRSRLEPLVAQLGYVLEREGTMPVAATAADATEYRDCRDVFSACVPLRLDALPAGSSGRLKFTVTGSETGSWLVDLESHAVAPVDAETSADCTFRMEARTLLALANGRLNAFDAYRRGLVAVAGQLELVDVAARLL